MLEKCRQSSGQVFSLRELLNVPLQRILKYPLLLRELFAATNVEHPDKQGVARALYAMSNLASWINSTKRSYDEVVRLAADIQGLNDPEGLPELGFLEERGDAVWRGPAGHAVGLGKSSPDAIKAHCVLLSSAVLICNARSKGAHMFVTQIELAPNFKVGHGCERARARASELPATLPPSLCCLCI